MSQVVIGMDPHKRTATIEVMAGDEAVAGRGRYATDAAGYAAMLAEARRWPQRTCGLLRVFRTGDLRLIMLLPACSDTRRGSLAEFCTRVRNEDASDCTGSRCSGQYRRVPSFSSGRPCGARARLSVRH